ncbi:MAG: tetratricopeptide repeat protein [Kovacikia sp.]
MKTRNWLNITEYLLLFGTGIGSIVSALLFQQILLTAAPMSLLFLLNLINRRRIEESAQQDTAASISGLDQKLSTDIAALQQQAQVLPNFLDLASLRKSVLSKNEEGLNGLAQEVAQLKQEIAKPDMHLLRQDIRQLQEQYGGVAESLTNITNQLNRLSSTNRTESLEGAIAQLKSELSHVQTNLQNLGEEQRTQNSRVLQDQINHLNRRLNNLPTPFDASSLKKDMDALVKMMGDMVSRRELARLTAQIEKLNQQSESVEKSVMPLKVATAILKKQLDTLNSRVSSREQIADQVLDAALRQPQAPMMDSLRNTITSLEQRLNQLPASSDLSNLRVEMQGMVTAQLGQLQQQLNSMQQFSQTLDRQQKTLRDWVNRLPQTLDTSTLQSEVKYLAARVEWAETNATDVHAQIEAAVKNQLGEVTQQLQASYPTPQYELVFDIKAASQGASQGGSQTAHGCSRSALEEALEKAQARLIIVFPFPSPDTLNSEVIQKFRVFLDRQGCLDIGWGHLGDVGQHPVSRPIARRRVINPTERGFLYETLNQLTQLKRQYPNQFRFKVLGTSENFLVCDRSFAILGAQSIATASIVFPQAAVGLRTTDLDVIQGLVGRFDDPMLDATDTIAYYNRATTRYDLGDVPGAIADYTQVLRFNPDADAAYNNRGLAYYDQENRQKAIQDFGLAVQSNPRNFIAYCNRGFIRSEMGDKLGAIEDYTYALQINPDYSTAYFYRGLARTRLQNKLGAIEDYSEVIRLNPQDATAYFYRGLAEIKIGQRLNAINDLHQAAQLFSEQGDTENYQQTLRTIKKLHKTLVIEGTEKPLVSNGA